MTNRGLENLQGNEEQRQRNVVTVRYNSDAREFATRVAIEGLIHLPSSVSAYAVAQGAEEFLEACLKNKTVARVGFFSGIVDGQPKIFTNVRFFTENQEIDERAVEQVREDYARTMGKICRSEIAPQFYPYIGDNPAGNKFSAENIVGVERTFSAHRLGVAVFQRS